MYKPSARSIVAAQETMSYTFARPMDKFDIRWAHRNLEQDKANKDRKLMWATKFRILGITGVTMKRGSR